MADRYVGLPLDSFALLDGESLQRPEVIRQLTFESVYPRAYWFEAVPFARAIVPIEMAKTGDEQVVVHIRAGERKPPLSIDFLADLPSVVSVVADRLVTARRPLPQIRELFVLNFGATVDEETLSNLPGLVSLSLGNGCVRRELGLDEVSTYDYEADKIDLGVLQRMAGLRDLRFHALAARSIEPLRSLAGLERLRIEGISSERNAALLAGLGKLRWLALEYWKGMRSLGGLENLERVELMEASFSNFKLFKAWRKVRLLALSGRGVKSLEGIGALESLEELFLGRPGIQDLTPLASATKLRRLELISLDQAADLSPIGRLEKLRSLIVTMGSVTSTAHVENIDFVAGLEHLEELQITGAVIEDGRLDALFGLPEIRRVRLLGDYGDQVDKLRSQKEGCDIQVPPLAPETAAEVIQAGALTIRKHDEDFWSIFQDLSDLLGVEDNFAADRNVRRAIRQRDAELFKRLEFDPDADFVSIRALSKTDIQRAADIIQSILDTSTAARR